MTTNTPIDPTALKNANTWLNGHYDEDTKESIRRMIKENPSEVTESFYRNLEFGTGGLRGIMGIGTNRMNTYVVAMATQGLANYVLKSFPQLKTCRAAVAFDSRNNSKEFAQITAEVLAANGIEVYLFKELRPTPELSFAIRHFQCQTGVIITASHNPKEYNGYKAYWDDGAQLIEPHDTNVIKEVLSIQDISEVKRQPNSKLIHLIEEDFDQIYLDKIKEHVLNPLCIEKQKDLKIIYTPLHGTGITLVPKALREIGFHNILCVPEQSIPDGNFPSCKSPNPEEKAALEMAIQLAKQENADLVMATDPDADRVGIAVRKNGTDWLLLNGNQTASILVYYLLSQWKEKNKLTGNEYIIKTIVTTELIKNMADQQSVECFDVLTGFKYIAGKIKELENKKVFIGGGEESYGFMIGDFVRDKDAVSACCMIAEIAAWAAEQKKSLIDLLVDISLKYGCYKEGLLSITLKGKSGAEEIKQMMKNYRNAPPTHINGSKLVFIKDYQTRKFSNLRDGSVEAIPLPESDVLQFYTADESKITVRPSGTEPKIKYYFSVKAPLHKAEDYPEVESQLESKIFAIQKDMHLLD